jgi:hypothetical protein
MKCFIKNKNRLYGAFAVGGLLLIGLYLLRLHYVQDYSDPVGFVGRALRWATVGDHADRAPLYPIILYGLIQLLGRDWVFVANIPFILLLLVMLGLCTRSLFAEKQSWSSWCFFAAGIIPGVIFFAARASLLQQMVNPYREPIALLMLLAVAYLYVRGWNKGSLILGGLAGMLLGGATSIRETSLLLVLPLAIWGLQDMWQHRRIRFGFILVFGLGLMIGLLPLLIKNYQYSGSSLVPAYSAGRVSRYAATGSWDIPIPGMSIRYFSTVAPVTLRETLTHYTPIGGILFLVGVLMAVIRRNRDILYLYLPAFLVYFLFYCFYNRYLGRYLLTAEVFAVPVAAYGLIAAWHEVEHHAPGILCGWIPVLRRTLALCLVGLYLVFLLPPIFKGNAGTKVWNLEPIRQELRLVIEEPAIFMGGRHFCYRMSWLLDQSFYEYTLGFQRERQTYGSVEERLAAQGRDTVSQFSEGNYYIDESPFALAANWLQRDAVFDFADLSVPFEHYGRQVDGSLYRVRRWQQNQTELISSELRSAKTVLMLDMKRPWDYPDRTVLKGGEPGLPTVEHELTNGVQFVELPGRAGTTPFSFSIMSDAPVPPAPAWRLIGLNDDIVMSFGMEADLWAWNWASESLFPNACVPRDACLLHDEGEIKLPFYADEGYDVYAEVLVEAIRQHPYWLEKKHYIHIDSPVYAESWELPLPQHQGKFVVPLGKGTGVLEAKQLKLRTTLPSAEIQKSPEFCLKIPQDAFVKIYQVRVFSHRPATQFPVEVDVGGQDTHAVGSGFFAKERNGDHTGRWTGETANLRLRRQAALPGRVRVSVLPLRPSAFGSGLSFKINGQSVPVDHMHQEKSGALERYDFPVDPKRFAHNDDWLRLSIDAKTWNPAKAGIANDHRDLGVFVTRVEFL